MKTRYQRLTNKTVFSIFVIVIYIFGQTLPIPWIREQEINSNAGNNILLLIQSVIGGSGERTSILVLGLMPWMTASIIVQLISLSYNNERGKISANSLQKKIRILTLIFAVIHAYIRSETMEYRIYINDSYVMTRLAVIFVMIAGAFFVLWLAEQNSVKGIGGAALIILVNILKNIVQIVMGMILDFGSEPHSGSNNLYMLIILFFLGILGVMTIVILENSEVRLPMQRVMIDNEMVTENYIAIKVSPSGTQPMMYVMSFYLLPFFFFKILNALFKESIITQYLAENISFYHPLGLAVYIAMFIFVTVSLSYVQINPGDIAGQMEEKGDCIVGLCPGKDTEQYLKSVVMNHSIISAAILSVFIAIPMLIQILWKVDSQIFMIPMLLMIVTGIMLNIFTELRVIKLLDNYQAVL